MQDDASVGAAVQEDTGGAWPKRARTMDPKEVERRTVYWQFIVGMLTNSAPAMPLSQISMMMKIIASVPTVTP